MVSDRKILNGRCPNGKCPNGKCHKWQMSHMANVCKEIITNWKYSAVSDHKTCRGLRPCFQPRGQCLEFFCTSCDDPDIVPDLMVPQTWVQLAHAEKSDSYLLLLIIDLD